MFGVCYEFDSFISVTHAEWNCACACTCVSVHTRPVLGFVAEAGLCLLASQALRVFKDPSFPLRDKQRLKRELGAELVRCSVLWISLLYFKFAFCITGYTLFLLSYHSNPPNRNPYNLVLYVRHEEEAQFLQPNSSSHRLPPHPLPCLVRPHLARHGWAVLLACPDHKVSRNRHSHCC